MNDRWVIPTLHSARNGGKAESITLVSWIQLGGEFNRVVDWLAPPASSLYRMSPPTPSFVLASFKGQRTRLTYASPFHSLRPCWVIAFNILWFQDRCLLLLVVAAKTSAH